MEEENMRELRSSRSRSAIPFLLGSRDRESTHVTEDVRHVTATAQTKGSRLRVGNRQESGQTSVRESHTSEASVTTVKHVHRKASDDSDSSVEHVAEDDRKIGRSSDRQRARRRLLINGATPWKDDEVLAVTAEAVGKEKLQKSDHYNMSNYSAEEERGIAYRIYKKAGDWWNKFPKTDYTYSRVSPHRKELAPGVIAMPNMSRRSLNTVRQHSRSENNISGGTGVSVSKRDVTTSRWFDQTSSGSLASKKVLQDWDAFDSDVDDVAEAVSSQTSRHISKSRTVTSRISSYFIAIWTFIIDSFTHTVDAAYRLVGRRRDTHFYATPPRMSSVWVEGSSSWLQKLFIWVHRLVSSVMRLDTLLLSKWHASQKEHEHGAYYEKYDYMEVDVSSESSSRKHNARLLFLLLPLIFLAGWWSASGASGYVLNPLIGATDTVWNTLVGWMFIPFGAYSALKEKLFMNPASPELPPVVLPYVGEDRQQQQAVDMETLARYVLASAEFQQLLTAQVQKETQAAQKDTTQLQSAYLHQKHLHYMNVKLLTEQKATLSQLTHHLHHMQQKVNHLYSESKEDQAHEQEWKLKFEKEKQAWREEAAAQSLTRDGDQVLMRKELRDVQSRLRLLQEQQAQILRRCCQRSTGPVAVDEEVIEQHVFRVLSGLLGATGGQFSGNPEDLRAWVSSMLVAQNDLDARLANLTFTLHLQTREAVQRSKEIIMASISEHIQNEFSKWQELQHQHDVKTSISSSMGTWVTNSTGMAGLTDLQVRAIVDEALAKYDADKTGLVDYALESSGGSIISTRCTETYQAKTAKLSVLGIPLWYPSNNPRTVIQPGVHPGECWAFSGSQGFLVIQLSGLVQITAFSLEHIPLSLSPHGRIDSAPKDFTVWGLKELEDMEPVLLGKYTYQQNGTSLQNFSVQSGVDAFEIVELRIESNHGNMEYTCLYRFRVHGVLLSK